MKTVKVELTIDQWKLREDITELLYTNQVADVLEIYRERLLDGLPDILSEYLNGEDQEQCENEIWTELLGAKLSVLGDHYEHYEKTQDAVDTIYELVEEIEEQAKTQ